MRLLFNRPIGQPPVLPLHREGLSAPAEGAPRSEPSARVTQPAPPKSTSSAVAAHRAALSAQVSPEASVWSLDSGCSSPGARSPLPAAAQQGQLPAEELRARLQALVDGETAVRRHHRFRLPSQMSSPAPEPLRPGAGTTQVAAPSVLAQREPGPTDSPAGTAARIITSDDYVSGVNLGLVFGLVVLVRLFYGAD